MMSLINIIGFLLLVAYVAMLMACMDMIKREAYPRIVRLQLWWVWIPIVGLIAY